MTIIANPPFVYGNEITKTVLENIDFDNYINIMPMSGYKKNNLAAHIIKTEPLPKDAFKDATVQAYVSVLRKEAREVDVTLNYREDLQKFYRENLKRLKTYAKWIANLKPKAYLESLPRTQTFLVGMRVCNNGVHTTKNCWDYEYNLTDNPIEFPGNFRGGTVMGMLFNTETEKKNFCDYWYRANLSHKLIKGMYKSSGSCEDAIPRVDWSRPWTDEEILREFGYDKPSEIREIIK